jgi:hypothetical protein
MRKIIVTLLLLAVPVAPAQASNGSELQRCPQWEPLMKQHGLPIKGKINFSYLAWRESRCIAQATGFNYVTTSGAANCVKQHWRIYVKTCKELRPHGRGVDWGILQINGSWRTLTTQICGKPPETGVLLRPKCNIKVAAFLYHKGGGAANWGYPSNQPSRSLQ